MVSLRILRICSEKLLCLRFESATKREVVSVFGSDFRDEPGHINYGCGLRAFSPFGVCSEVLGPIFNADNTAAGH